MPIYEYQCTACGHQLEEFQKISDPVLVECPVCHQSSLNKLVSAAGFQLKGSGWYVTDYSNKGKPPKTETPAQDTNKDTKTTTDKKDSKSSDSSSSTSGAA